MSILNKALKDLEQREQPHELGLEPTVELAPYRSKSRMLLVALGVLVTLAAIAGAYYLIPEKPQETVVEDAQGLVTAPLPEQVEQVPTSVAEQVIKPHQPGVDDEAAYRARAEEQAKRVAQSESQQSTTSIANTAPEQAPEPAAPANENVEQVVAAKQPSEPEAQSVASVEPIAEPVAQPVVKTSTNSSVQQPSSKNTAQVKVRSLSDEERAQSWYEQAQQSMQYGMTVEGISQLEQALVLNPKHVQARSLLAATLYAQQRVSEAQTILVNGIKLLPPALNWRVLLAKIAISEQQYGAVLQALPNHLDEQAQALQDNDYWILKGTAASKLEQHQVAKESFTQMVRRQPNVAKWWLALATNEEALGEKSEARSHYATALQLGGLSVQSQQYAQARYEGLQE